MAPTTEDVLAAGMIVFNLSISDIKQKTRKREIVIPRQVIQYMCWRLQTDTLSTIAAKTGLKNHATILYAYGQIGTQAAIYQKIADMVSKMERVLSSFGFDMGPDVPKGKAIWKIEPEKKSVAIPVRITDTRTGNNIVVESIAAASRLTGINQTSAWRACNFGAKIMGHYKFEPHEQS